MADAIAKPVKMAIIKNKWIGELEGLSLKNVEIGLYKGNKKGRGEGWTRRYKMTGHFDQ